MRRLAAALLAPAFALAAVAAAAAAPSTDASEWAKPQIQRVVAAGFLADSVASFDGGAPLDEAALQSVIERLNTLFAPQAPPVPAATTTTTGPIVTTTTVVPTTTTTPTATAAALPAPVGRSAPWPPLRWVATDPSRAVSVATFDRVLVNALGLNAASKRIRVELQRVGLRPPARAGSEAVARLLGLRLNHPAAQDSLELLPAQPITRAEAAYSLAQVLDNGLARRDAVLATAATFALPDLTPWQQRILKTAVAFVGFPYVWGGTSPVLTSPLGVQAAGGFDCSGFVWRVYKLTQYPGSGGLADVIRGRTTYQMAGEMPAAGRIHDPAALEPGDVLFFGRGPRSNPAEISHTGIYLGNGWIVHSSRYGTTITPFDGWYRTSFAWARRPLVEAGLELVSE